MLTGVFKNTAPGSDDHIPNIEGEQALFFFAYPEAAIFQDYTTVGGTNSAPTYSFDPYEDVTLAEARSRTEGKFVFSQEIWDDMITNYVVRAGNSVTTPALDRLAEMGVATIQIADQSKRTPKATVRFR